MKSMTSADARWRRNLTVRPKTLVTVIETDTTNPVASTADEFGPNGKHLK